MAEPLTTDFPQPPSSSALEKIIRQYKFFIDLHFPKSNFTQIIQRASSNVTYSLHLESYSWWTANKPRLILEPMKKLIASSSPREVFGRNLRLARRIKELSQEQLALDANLSRTYVSEVERGVRNVSIDNMGLLADALGIPLKDLVDPEMFAAMDERLG